MRLNRLLLVYIFVCCGGSYVTSDSENDFGDSKLQNSNSDIYNLSTHELLIHSAEIIEQKEFVSTEKDVSNHIFDIH